ncbi:MAG: hypothetical protein OEW66_07815 [Actinomycetota bacterium]|nr:hypothetical protein [Actinomycetota bacterium]MDH5313726.1 hypothetical protein [Actinomycetota bacterium]
MKIVQLDFGGAPVIVSLTASLRLSRSTVIRQSADPEQDPVFFALRGPAETSVKG